MGYRTIIVEDEPHALNLLKHQLLDDHAEDIDIIGEATDGLQAVEMINALKPDLVFMDVGLPNLSAFEIVKRLETKPILIFATADKSYALEAFGTNAIGYVVKPVDEDELRIVIDKLKLVSPLANLLLREVSEKLSGAWDATGRIAVKVNDVTFYLATEEILFFQLGLTGVQVATRSKKYPVPRSLDDLDLTYKKKGFLRIHRSTIVNLEHVKATKPLDEGAEVHLKDCSEVIYASRGGAKKLKTKLPSVVGSG